jgi:hypothetical protein
MRFRYANGKIIPMVGHGVPRNSPVLIVASETDEPTKRILSLIIARKSRRHDADESRRGRETR